MRTTTWINAMMLALLAIPASGCGSDCTEGSTQACACMGGLTGVQTCVAGGSYAQCDCGQLSAEEARRLVQSQADFTDGVMCSVSVTEAGHGRYTIESSLYSGCGRALERRGLARLGGCGVTCGVTVIEPVAPAQIEAQRLRFRCGDVSLIGVSGISTTGNTAQFRYEREVTLDQELIAGVSDCRLNVAEAGRAERERTARRDDAGNWSLVTATR